MVRTIVAGLALVVAAGAVVVQAQEDPIAARKAIYKEWGRLTKEPGQMVKGEAPFDLAKVQAALKAYQEGSARLASLFPESSKTGDTDALPAIWDDKAKFDALFVKLTGDAQQALASIKDEASFKTEFPKVLADCGACHRPFRAKR